MDETFDIQSYMTRGVERVVSDAVRTTLKNPKESVYMARFALASKSASKKRRKASVICIAPDVIRDVIMQRLTANRSNNFQVRNGLRYLMRRMISVLALFS